MKTCRMLAGTLAAVALSTIGPGPCTTARAGNAGVTAAEGIVTVKDFTFADGGTLPSLRLHYLTMGTPRRDAAGHVTNAVLLLHGTTGSAEQFLGHGFAEALYGPGQPLDTGKLFLVVPDGIGAGGSSKPSDGLHARFPRYGYRDQVRAQHDLLERIGVTHLKLVLGTSMGGMQTWLWGETYPDAMDGLVAIASTPAAISGRNMMWRHMISQAVRQDPTWRGGDYAQDAPPRDWLRTAMPLFAIMTGSADQIQKEAPTRAAAMDLVARLEAAGRAIDANDYVYTFESSADYDPAPRLGAVTRPVLAINFADDLLNPPDLLDFTRASTVTAVLLPGGPHGYGHQTLAHAALWAPALRSFLEHVPGWP